MLHGRSDSEQQQLRDLLAFHVIPWLSVPQALALSHTCSDLWTLIHAGLPDTTWASLACKVFPPSHPVLALKGSDLLLEMRTLLSTHAAIRKGCIHSMTTHCLYKREAGDFMSVNHSGTYALGHLNHNLQLHRLDVGAEKPDQGVIWSQPCPDTHGPSSNCEVFWAPSDRWAVVCILYPNLISASFEPLDDPSKNAAYILEMDTMNMFEITPSLELAVMQDPCISPDSTLVLIPWCGSSFAVDIYSSSKPDRLARIHDLGSRFSDDEILDVQVSFSPNSMHFAVAHTGDVHVYDVNGGLKSVLHTSKAIGASAEDVRGRTAWSPDGSSIAYWQLDHATSLYLFDPVHGHLQASGPVAADHPEFGGGLLWGHYGLVSVGMSYKRRWFTSMMMGCNTFSSRDMQDDAPLTEPTKVDVGSCGPVLSPDGAFIAALDGADLRVRVFDVQSHACVLQQVTEEGRAHPRLICDLNWWPSGRSLVLTKRFHRCITKDRLDHVYLTVLRF